MRPVPKRPLRYLPGHVISAHGRTPHTYLGSVSIPRHRGDWGLGVSPSTHPAIHRPYDQPHALGQPPPAVVPLIKTKHEPGWFQAADRLPRARGHPGAESKQLSVRGRGGIAWGLRSAGELPDRAQDLVAADVFQQRRVGARLHAIGDVRGVDREEQYLDAG